MSGSISAVIPVHNQARFLGEALESVFAQTVQPREVVVVDDGSEDDVAGVVGRFAGVHFIQREHTGPAAARNVGIAVTSGEFIALLDADDCWLPRKLEAQLALFAERPELGLALCLQRYAFEESEGIPGWFRGPRDGGAERGAVPSNWLLRRSAWETVGPFNEALRYAEDPEWFARALRAGIEHAYVEETLVVKRIHAGNATALVDANHASMLRVLRWKLESERR